jgi:hypothetical protein
MVKGLIMLRWLFAFLLLPLVASAQVGVPSSPSIQNGFGTLTVSNSSIAISTLTAGPNSAAWSMPLFGTLVVNNQGANPAWICPFGGACTASNGFQIAAGGNITFSLGGQTVSPTVISTAGTTLAIGW